MANILFQNRDVRLLPSGGCRRGALEKRASETMLLLKNSSQRL